MNNNQNNNANNANAPPAYVYQDAGSLIGYKESDFTSQMFPALIPPPFPYVTTYHGFLTETGLDAGVSSSIIWGMYTAIESAAANGEWLPFQVDDEDPDVSLRFNTYLSSVAATRYAVDLCAAYKYGKCSTANIKTYFLSHNIKGVGNGAVDNLCRWAVARYDHILNDAVIEAACKATSWLKYRLTYSSTGRLGVDVIDSLGMTLAVKVFGQDQINCIIASANRPWIRGLNDAITKRSIAIIAIYNRATNRDYGDWYQGDRAVDEISNSLRTSLKDYFTALENNRPKVDENTPDDELIDAGVFFS